MDFTCHYSAGFTLDTYAHVTTDAQLKAAQTMGNILSMEEVQSIVALGAGAVTKALFENGRIERCENVKDIKTYLEKTDEMLDRKRRLFAKTE